MATIAFLGTGTMGLPMARNLARAGFDLRAWNRSGERARPLAEDGVQVADTPGEAAQDAELMVTVLSETEAVLDVAQQAVGRLAAGAIWVQCSTIGIEGTERCRELAERAGVDFVDAPVLGTREPAEQGKLVILASGQDEALARCRPLFEAIGQRVLSLGDAGEGSRCKVAVNSWIVGLVGVLAETISLFEALDVDPRRFFQAVEGGALDLPYAHIKGEQMIERSFDDPAFRLMLSRKDAELVLAAAAGEGLALPIMQATTARLRKAEEAGHGDEDMAATYWATAPTTGASASNARRR